MHRARRWLGGLALCTLVASGCSTPRSHAEIVREANESLEQAGAPFRWQHEDAGGGDSIVRRVLIGTPAPTSADEKLQADVRALIGRAEVMKGRSADVQIVETRALPPEGSQVRETWVVETEKDGRFAYLIVLEPSPQGGTGMSVSGPWKVSD